MKKYRIILTKGGFCFFFLLVVCIVSFVACNRVVRFGSGGNSKTKIDSTIVCQISFQSQTTTFTLLNKEVSASSEEKLNALADMLRVMSIPRIHADKQTFILYKDGQYSLTSEKIQPLHMPAQEHFEGNYIEDPNEVYKVVLDNQYMSLYNKEGKVVDKQPHRITYFQQLADTILNNPSFAKKVNIGNMLLPLNLQARNYIDRSLQSFFISKKGNISYQGQYMMVRYPMGQGTASGNQINIVARAPIKATMNNNTSVLGGEGNTIDAMTEEEIQKILEGKNVELLDKVVIIDTATQTIQGEIIYRGAEQIVNITKYKTTDGTQNVETSYSETYEYNPLIEEPLTHVSETQFTDVKIISNIP